MMTEFSFLNELSLNGLFCRDFIYIYIHIIFHMLAFTCRAVLISSSLSMEIEMVGLKSKVIQTKEMLLQYIDITDGGL